MPFLLKSNTHAYLNGVRLLLFFAALHIPTFASACNVRNEDEVVKTVERRYQITNKDGSIDRFVYVFSAHFTGCMEQSGRASHFPDHPIDNRACYYSAGSAIVREGFYITAGGRRASLGDIRKAYSNPIRRTDFGSGVLGHSTCGDNFGAYDSLKASIKTQLVNSMDTLLMTDIIPDSLKDAATVTKGKLTPVD